MNRKTFGLGNILLGTVISIAIFTLGFWSKLVRGECILEFLLSLTSFLLAIAFLFYNIIVVEGNTLLFKYFNPFKKNLSIHFNEIDKVNIRIDGYKWSFGKVTVYKKNGSATKLNNLSSSGSLNELYSFLTNNGVIVEKSGIW